jgi:hypothetical protein
MINVGFVLQMPVFAEFQIIEMFVEKNYLKCKKNKKKT